ncbi:MAG: response regulator [Gemmatimonadetes bacterium]|nr:response regulator [Gemmatimonadota bacterium]
MSRPILMSLVLCACFVLEATAQNQVLRLQERGDYVELPADLFLDAEAATVEAWVKWEDFSYYSQWFAFGSGSQLQAMGLNHEAWNRTPQFFIYDRERALHLVKVAANLPLGEWLHMAAVSGPGGMRLYLNGVAVAANDYPGSFAAIGNGEASYLGRSSWPDNLDFVGQLDEVRVWGTARAGAQIRAAMHVTLRGDEPGLAALWNFDGPCSDGITVRDQSGHGLHGVLKGKANCVNGMVPAHVPPPARLHGVVKHSMGMPQPLATVRLFQGEDEVAVALTDTNGVYEIQVLGDGPFDLQARSETENAWIQDVRMQPGAVAQRVDVSLRFQTVFQGRILALDATPQRGVIAEALPTTAGVGRMAATDAQGRYRFDDLRPGRYRIRLHRQGEFSWLTTGGSTPDSLQAAVFATQRDHSTTVPLVVEPPVHQGVWRTFGAFEGLRANEITDMTSGLDGTLWASTAGAGVWSYDGENFEQWTTREGLPHDEVRAVHATRDGAIWFATAAGAVRWDGGPFAVWSRADGLPHESVTTLFEGSDGKVWIGTAAGAVWWEDGSLGSDAVVDEALGYTMVTDFVEDDAGDLWISTSGQGAWRRHDGGMEPYSRPESIGDTRVWALAQAPDGGMWFGTENGLTRLHNGVTRTWFTFEEGVAQHQIVDLHIGPDGSVWGATTGGGVLRTDGEHFVLYGVNDGLSHAGVSAIHHDYQGGVWFGASDGSLTRYDDFRFAHYAGRHGLRARSVRDVLAGPAGDVLLGTDKGLYAWRGDRFTQIGLDRGLREQVSSLARADGVAWIGVSGGVGIGGVWSLDEQGPRRLSLPAGTRFQDVVHDLFVDRSGVLWAATLGGAMGLMPGENTLTATHDAWVADQVKAISQDQDGRIWLGTDGRGVVLFEEPVIDSLTVADGLADDRVTAIHRDSRGHMWIGTRDGLSRHDGQRLTTYSTRDGLPHNHIEDITTGPDGRLWIATFGGGLAIFHGEMWSSLDTRDGLGDDRAQALALDGTGDLWVGTVNGLARYRESESLPRVRLTGMRSDTLQADLDQPPTVEAGRRLSVSFAAIDFETWPAKRQYRYRTLGADSTWRSTGKPTVEWTPSEAGTVTFQVKAVDGALRVSEPAQMTVRVVLPWYQDIRFAGPLWICVVFVVVTAVYLGRRGLSHRHVARMLREQMLEQERQAHAELEIRNVELEAARHEAEEANRAKSAFLAGMSHELRTPLNAILGFSQMLARSEGIVTSDRENVQIINRSGEHLLALINDVLEMSRIEAGRTELAEEVLDLHELVASVVVMFRLRVQQNGVELSHTIAGTVAKHVRADAGKLRQILINLLSNAAKFTKNGQIDVTVHGGGDGDRAQFVVTDTGPGISQEEQRRLFEPFVQTQSGRSEGKGTGLGLTISRQFARLMGGDLTASSVEGEGSSFCLDIPLKVVDAAPVTGRVTRRRILSLAASQASRRILVVEDGEENRLLLRRMLEPIGFEIREAVDGEQGIQVWETWQPHLIIMDMRMPVLDGYEASRRIKSTPAGSDTPIIALTASAFEEDRQRVAEAGCDDFVRKPFDELDLLERIGQHLGVHYEYDDDAPPAVGTAEHVSETPPLAALSEGLRERIHDAAFTADGETLLDIVSGLRATHAEDASALQHMIDDYAFDRIMALTEG